jgi:hypothetical protein
VDRSRHAFFPASASVGAEGMIGVSLLATPPRSPFSAVELSSMGELLDHHCARRDAVFVYACNSYHSIAERLARWLLILHDRVAQDMLSQMLAAAKLRALRTSSTASASSRWRANATRRPAAIDSCCHG